MVNSLDTSSLLFTAGHTFVILALILHAAGFSIPHFLEETISELETSNSGLWQTCTEKRNEYTCQGSLYTEKGWLLCAKILQCIGLIGTSLTTLLSFTVLLAVTDRRLKIANVFVCSSALTVVSIGTVLTAKMVHIKPGNSSFISRTLGLSFYLCLGATVALVLACIAFIVNYKRTNR